MTPEELARELGISGKTLRAWLRSEYPRAPQDRGSAWWLSAGQIEAARRRFAHRTAAARGAFDSDALSFNSPFAAAEFPRTAYFKFFAGVNPRSTSALMDAVDAKLREGVQRIVLLISTPGGTVFHGLSVHNFLSGLPVEIETHNFGQVDSIGLVMFMAGTRRLCVPDARFLLHTVAANFPAGASLEEPQLEERLRSLKIDTANIASVIGKASGRSEAEVVSLMTARQTLNAEEAQAMGFVHEVRRELLPPAADLVSIQMPD